YSFTTPTSAFTLIPQEDYEKLSGETLNLAADDIAMYDSTGDIELSTLSIWGSNYGVKAIDGIPKVLENNETLSDLIVIVMPSTTSIDRLIETTQDDDFPLNYRASLQFNLNEESNTENKQFSEGLQEFIASENKNFGYYYEARALQREEWYVMNGG